MVGDEVEHFMSVALFADSVSTSAFGDPDGGEWQLFSFSFVGDFPISVIHPFPIFPSGEAGSGEMAGALMPFSGLLFGGVSAAVIGGSTRSENHCFKDEGRAGDEVVVNAEKDGGYGMLPDAV